MRYPKTLESSIKYILKYPGQKKNVKRLWSRDQEPTVKAPYPFLLKKNLFE